MKSAKEIISTISEDTCVSPGCICERCNKGIECFMLPSDIDAIQLDAQISGMEKAAEIAHLAQFGDSHPPHAEILSAIEQLKAEHTCK